jgi:hypothetical protein
MTKPPKVESMAVNEMKDELLKLIQNSKLIYLCRKFK